jgi:hypothetical protein
MSNKELRKAKGRNAWTIFSFFSLRDSLFDIRHSLAFSLSVGSLALDPSWLVPQK